MSCLVDRLFYSSQLSILYKFYRKSVDKSLTKYILEGIEVSEYHIQPLEIRITNRETVYIEDLFEVIQLEEE